MIAPSSLRETVPEVYVVWLFAIPEMAVCVSGCAPEMRERHGSHRWWTPRAVMLLPADQRQLG